MARSSTANISVEAGPLEDFLHSIRITNLAGSRSARLQPKSALDNFDLQLVGKLGLPAKKMSKLLRDAEANISKGLWDDQEGDPPDHDDTAAIDQEIFNFKPIQDRTSEPPPQPEQQDEQFEAPGATPLSTPRRIEEQPMDLSTIPGSLQEQRQLQQGHPDTTIQQQTDYHIQQQTDYHIQQQQTSNYQQHQQQANTYIDSRTINIRVDSPTSQRYQQYGQTNFGAVPRTPRNRPRSRTPNRETREAPEAKQRPAAAGSQQLSSTPQPVQDQLQEQQAQHDSAPSQPDSLPQLPMKRPATSPPDVAMTNYLIYDDGTMAPVPMSWDGSPDLQYPSARRDNFYQAYLASNHRKVEMADIEEPSRPDLDSSSDEELTVSNNRSMTRQELKQMDREIPWRQIVEDNQDTFWRYVDAATNEFQGWLEWNGIIPVDDKTAAKIRADPRTRRRILKSRAAYRDKNRGVPPLKPKCRVVIVGCGDPDIRQLSRDSPTPTRISEFLILAVATSGANRAFNQDGCLWKLWLGDAEKAFLQGEQDTSERDGPIWMEPPRDPILVAANAYPAQLYQVTGNCYGLCNAPRTWYKKVDGDLKHARFKQHSLDRCCYYLLNDENQLIAILIVHVDDFMMTYNCEKYSIDDFKALFRWGSTTDISLETSGEYRGKEIQLKKDSNGKFNYVITQTKFIQAMDSGHVTKERLKGEKLLTAEELGELRSVIGSLQWLSGQTRPDLAATASLCHHGAKSEIGDLQKAYEAIEYAKATMNDGITMPAIPFNRATTILAYGDSSWCNAVNFTSQYGVLIVLCPPQVSECTCQGMIIDWKSGRMQRVARSTLAAEANAADEAADRACFSNHFITELLYGIPAFHGNMEMAMKQATDAKSLYDCLISENPSTLEKRSMVSIRSVQQSMSPKQVHWIPTHLMHCDGLTKIDQKLMMALTKWCMRPWCQLRDEAPSKMMTPAAEANAADEKMPMRTTKTSVKIPVAHAPFFHCVARFALTIDASNLLPFWAQCPNFSDGR